MDLAKHGLRVKPLGWEDQSRGSYVWQDGLHYYAECGDDPDDWYWSCMIGNDDVFAGENHMTREACKAAAQADYEARISASLEATA